MTIVYDPLTYRTVVARPGEIPYKFWSVNKHVIDAASAGICTLHSGDDAPADTTKLWLDLTMPENAVGAVKAHNGSDWVALTPALFYSHIAGGAGGFVTNLEMETYVSGLLGVTIQAWGENLDQWSAIDPTGKEDTGVAATLIAAHEAAANPHPTYLTTAEGDAAYQPLDSDLTAIAALSTTAYGRALLALADAAALRTAAGLVIGTNVQAYDADLTTWAGLTPSANAQSLVTAADYSAMRTLLGLVIGTNVQAYDADLTTWAGLTPSANAQSLVTAANYAAMRGLLDLEAGTDFLSPAAIAAAYQPLDGDLTSWAGVTRASGYDTFAAMPSSANLRSLLTDETGTGAAVFGTAPTISSPVMTGTPDIQQALVISGDISPSQITSDQNDYAPTGLSTATVLRLNSDASRNITGLTGGADGRVLLVHNVGAFAIVLKDENASSAAANRFALNADVSLGADASTLLQYDGTSSRWRAVGGSGGGGGGSGDALVANPLSQFAATTSAQLRGVLSDETGTGAAYFQGGDIGTPSAGVGTNLTGIPLSGILDSTSEALGVGSLEVGHATDTTIARASAGRIAVEGVTLGPTNGTVTAAPTAATLDYTGIPSWVKRITITFVSLGTSGTSNPLIQIGDSGGVETSGYLGSGGYNQSGNVCSAANFTAGWGINYSISTNVIHGALTLSLHDPSANTWVISGVIGLSNIASCGFFVGSKSLSGTLDRIRITTAGGSDNIDAGAINIIYE